jgi:hypothetical protein
MRGIKSPEGKLHPFPDIGGRLSASAMNPKAAPSLAPEFSALKFAISFHGIRKDCPASLSRPQNEIPHESC